LPYYRFQLEVPLSPEAVAERMRAVTQEPRTFSEKFRRAWGFGKSGPPFVGYVEDLSFRLRRDIRHRNLFLPMIRAKVAPEPSGSRVSVTMYLNPVVAVFSVFWLYVFGYATWETAISPRVSGKPEFLVPAGVFVLFLAVAGGSFFFEARKAKRLLEAALGK
jgi:hypothetical protein